MARKRITNSQKIYLGIIILFLLGFGLSRYINDQENPNKPPALTVLMNNNIKREALLGIYEWRSQREITLADSDHPAMFMYDENSSLEASQGQKIYMSVAQNKGEFPHSIISLEVFKKGTMEKLKDASYSVNGNTLVLDIKEESGDYVYRILVDYEERGEAQYGLNVLVDLQRFSVETLKGLKTPYVGDHGKVGKILGELPVPGSGYVQRYLGLKTENRPYRIIAYYEPKEELTGNLMMPEKEPANEIHLNMEKNALVLLSLIDNAEEVTFKVRSTPSSGELKDEEYPSQITFTETELIEKYGSLDRILDNRDLFPLDAQE